MSDVSKMTAVLDSWGMDGTGLGKMLAGVFEQMEWAEDEIAKAQRRHRAAHNRLYHSFKLLVQPHELMRQEFVYRSHCREILERVAAGQDTRPGTAAEVAIACCESSQLAPLTSTGAGLYGRVWKLAGFPGEHWDDRQVHHEALSSSLIDDAEREMRRKLASDDRRFGVDDCGGMHHGEKVSCEFARAAGTEQLELLAS